MDRLFYECFSQGRGRRVIRRKPNWLKPEVMTLYTLDRGPGQPVETFMAWDYEEAAFELFSRLVVDDSGGPWKLAARNGDGDQIRVEARNESTGTGDEYVLILRGWLRFGGSTREEDFLPMPSGWGFRRKASR